MIEGPRRSCDSIFREGGQRMRLGGGVRMRIGGFSQVGKLKVTIGSKADKLILLLILVSSSIQVNNLTRLEAAGGGDGQRWYGCGGGR
jgi:hypothetical protein